MKKSLFALIALVGVCAILVSTRASAQSWSSPIPIGSDPNQYNANPVSPYWSAAKSNANYIKFTATLPTTPAGQNFSTYVVSLPDGTSVKVEDLLATPGLLPKDNPMAESLADMLDKMIVETFPPDPYVIDTTIFPHLARPDGTCCYADGDRMTVPPPFEPAHGFCPEPFKVVLGASPCHPYDSTNPACEPPYMEMVYECNALRSMRNRMNIADYEFTVADVRADSTPPHGEFDAVFGTAPVADVEGLFGSGQEKFPPYSEKTYPATIKMRPMTGGDDFVWTVKGVALDQPYEHVYANGIADFKEGAISASYDPVIVEKLARISMRTNVPSPASGLADEYVTGPLYGLLGPHYSPLIFFRKDAAIQRLLLAGYSALQFSTWRTGDADSASRFLWTLLMGFNFNPVDVVKLDREGKNYIAVVNQATLGDIDQEFFGPGGALTTDTFRRRMKKGEAGSAVDLDFSVLPHGVVSYVTFWKQMTPWTNDGLFTIPAGSYDNPTDNPNEVWQPVAFSLVGQMFDADVVKDADKQYLLVASSEPALDAGGAPHYFVYKIDPVQTSQTALSFKDVGTGTIEKTPGIVGTPFEVEPPDGDYEWSPYKIVSGNFQGNDACNGFAMTWRGIQTVPADNIRYIADTSPSTPYFDNHDGENVVFRKNESDMRMFSDAVTVYTGKKDASGKCVFAGPLAELRGLPPAGISSPALRQVAAVAVRHDGDNFDDIFAGNLNPEPTGSANEFGAYAYHYVVDATHPLGATVSSPERIRVGYETTNLGPPFDDKGYYLKGAAVGDLGKPNRAAVGVMDIDSYGNIGSVNGLPLMLPWMGCPTFGAATPPYDPYNSGDFEVSSTPEELMAVAVELRTLGTAAEGSFRDEASNVVPLRCVSLTSLPTEPYCGNNVREGSEECDGTDDDACPGLCTPNCTCASSVAGTCVAPHPYERCCEVTAPTCDTIVTSMSATSATEVDCCTLMTGCVRLVPSGRFVGENARLCEILAPCCTSSKLTSDKKEFYAQDPRGDGGGSTDGGGGTDFGARPDCVYDTKAPYIASMNALTPAQAQTNAPAANVRLNQNANVSKPTITIKPSTLTPAQIESFQKFLSGVGVSGSNADKVVNDVNKISPTSIEGILFKVFLNVVGTQTAPPANENEAQKPQALLDKALDRIGSMLFKEANAHTITGGHHDYSFRLPRGHTMPGKREMTVVLGTPPPIVLETCGNHVPDPGEQCDPPGLECPTDMMCNTGTCTCSKMPGACGNNHLDEGEACDGGTCPDGQACNADCTCPPPVGAPVCGNGILEGSEQCERGIPCSSGNVCDISCTCVPTTTVVDDCPDCCPGCCEPTCTTCERAAVKTVTISCIGGSSDAAIKHIDQLNKLMCEAVSGLVNSNGVCNAFFCEAEYGMWRAEVTLPGAAAPSMSPSELLSSSVSSDLTGNIGPAAFVQLNGSKPIDFTQTDHLPLKANMVERPTILLPSAPTVTPVGMKAMTLSADLMASATAVEPSLLSGAETDPSLATNVQVLPDNKMTFNNVISLQIKAADVSKAAGVTGNAFAIAEIRPQPLLCGYCPDSDAAKMGFGTINFGDVLKKAREFASLCSDGVCDHTFPEKIGMTTLYSNYGFTLVQGKVARAGESAEAPYIVQITGAAVPGEFGQGAGGCTCDMTSLPPDLVSIIAMILAASVATTGFVVVRARAKRK